jgi:hypothetical protein
MLEYFPQRDARIARRYNRRMDADDVFSRGSDT